MKRLEVSGAVPLIYRSLGVKRVKAPCQISAYVAQIEFVNDLSN